MTGPRIPPIRPFTEPDWLEEFRKKQAVAASQTRCCPRCQAGPVPGQFPCGRPGTCPNPDCAHGRGR